MQTFNVPAWLIWLMLVMFFILLISIVLLVIYYWKKYNKDVILLIDKSNRFILYYVDIGGSKSVKIEENAYFLNEDCAKLNTRGKALYIFSQGKPTALKIDYNKHAWLDSDTLLPVINNELVKQIVKPTDPAKELMILLGAIGGVIAGIASVVILLLQLGVISGGA